MQDSFSLSLKLTMCTVYRESFSYYEWKTPGHFITTEGVLLQDQFNLRFSHLKKKKKVIVISIFTHEHSIL